MRKLRVMKDIQGSNELYGDFKRRQRFGFINWFLPLYYILAQYSFIIANVGVVIMIIAALYKYLIYRKKLIIHKWVALFTGYCMLVQLMFHTIQNFSMTTINNLAMPILFLFIICVFSDDINENNLYKAYSIIGMIVMGAIFFQSINYYFWDKPAVPITILPVGLDESHYWGYFQGSRPSSFFTEPQAYASYMVPLLFLSLKRRRMIFAAVITLSIMLSTSSQGILITVIIWAVFLVLQAKGFITKFSTVVLAAGLAYLFFSTGIFEYSINKIETINVLDNIRISRGFEIYGTFDVWNKLFGIGTGNLFNYVYSNLNLFDWAYDYIRGGSMYLLGYYTGVSGTLIIYGLGAGLLLLFMFYRMGRYDDRSNLTFLIAFIATFFAQNMLFNDWFLFYSLLYLGVCNKNVYNKNYLKLSFKGISV